MNFDQAALVDLFRQSFSPLTQLSSGRLALAQEQLQRNQQMADRLGLMEANSRLETGRQLAVEEVRTQAGLESQRRSQEAALGLEEVRSKNARKASKGNARNMLEANRTLAEEARTAAATAQARKLAADLGLDVDLNDTEFVDNVTRLAVQEAKKHRGSATEIYKEMNGLTAQLDKHAAELEVPEARQLAIARPLLMAAATDEKKKAAYKKLNSVEAIMEAAADEVGAAEKISAALQREQMIRNQTFEKRARPIQTRQGQLQRTLQVLEQRGISPDYEAIRGVMPAAGTPVNDGGEGAADDTSLNPADLAGLFPQKQPRPGGDASVSGPSAQSQYSNPAYSLAGLFQRRRAIADGAVNMGMGMLAGPGNALDLTGRLGAAALSGITTGNFRMPDKGLVTRAGEGLGEFMAGGFDDELQRQQGKLALIDSLIGQAQSRGDIETARRLRSAKFGPELDDASILRSVVRNPGDSFALPNGTGMSRPAPLNFRY